LSELEKTVKTLLNFLKRQAAPIAGTMEDAPKAVQETISLLIGWKIAGVVEETPSAQETFYFVDDEKKLELEYYKNNIIHFFIPYALVAVSLLTGTRETKRTEEIIDDYGFLIWLFNREFVFDEDEEPRETVSGVMEYFRDSGYVAHSDEGYEVTKLGLAKLPIWAALAKTYLESYWVASRSLYQRYRQEGKREGGVKGMIDLAKRYHKQGIIEHIGALSQLNFKNAAGFFREKVFKPSKADGEPSPDLEKLSQVSQRLYELCHYRS
jgi:glycerol-3-phosphate O-acyltransferase